MLAVVGLSDLAERLYTDLVTHGPAGAGELARRSGTPPDETTVALGELAAQGLIAARHDDSTRPAPEGARANRTTTEGASPAAPGPAAPALPGPGPEDAAPGQPVLRYSAAPPAVALEALLAGRRHALRQAELSAAALAEAYRAATSDDAHRDLVEVVVGPAAIGHRVEQVQRGAKHELLALVTGQYDVVPADATGAETEAVERGVAYRVVIGRHSLGAPHTAEALFEALGRDQRIRVVDQVPTKLIIADGTLALVPLTTPGEAGEPAALLVRAPGLVNLMTILFEQVWAWAQPLGLEAGLPVVGNAPAGEPVGTDRRILALLLAGSTDQAVANQLGLGLRTVQRRIKAVMELAHAETRVQLGWQAHRRGWVED
ncbi:helix-turn-helix transcriptional regulator [Kitasatospora sp. NBC_00240]|uniref:helix-turn-helix transcriptional regulator n=1 Tax=Kitasatospora sp. NBC_00240 TaxID=2903567 RepID=UPI002254EDB3|nr:helix-turn-helix transcriptional regulator [Kitasatospora sp. NBC_00240]MCX5213860.1 helix-turn-helix transcriptional regulator [Kitasatospora sp. NBC_00240]